MVHGEQERFIGAEQSAEIYLSKNYGIEAEFNSVKYIDEYDRRITYLVGVSVLMVDI